MMYRVYSDGMIEVITGPMFSGKSEELIRRIKTLAYGKIKTLVIKPNIDKRWDEKKIITRAGFEIEAHNIKNSLEILDLIKSDDYNAICIDEAQFFDTNLINVVVELANSGKRVIISGLDQDSEGKPFGIMPQLLAIADVVEKQQAVCFNCGRAATMTFRKNTNNDNQVVIGDTEIYEARCRECHYKGQMQKLQQRTNETKIK